MNTPFTTNRQDYDDAEDNQSKNIASNDLIPRVIAFEIGIGLLGIGLIFLLNPSTLISSLMSLLSPVEFMLGALAGALAAGVVLALIISVPSLVKASAIQILKLFRNVSITKALVLALAAGVGEELLFRGALQPLLGSLLTSILFALLHPFGILYMSIAFLISMGLGWLAVLSNGLAAPTAAHACYDALIILAIQTRKMQLAIFDRNTSEE